jgi:hypothetical protein
VRFTFAKLVQGLGLSDSAPTIQHYQLSAGSSILFFKKAQFQFPPYEHPTHLLFKS